MPEKPLLEKLLSPKFLMGATGMGTAAAYIAYRHVDWKTKPDAKKRMAISHLVFWPLCVIGLKSMHLSFGLKENWQRALGVLASSGVVIGAFEGSIRLAKKLVPKQPVQSAPPMESVNPFVTQEVYQQGFNRGYQLGLRQTGQPVQYFNPRMPLNIR